MKKLDAYSPLGYSCAGKIIDLASTVFIATRHDSHAEFVLKALKAGKHVFVEKPLCLTIEELEEIKLAADPRRQAQTGEKEFCPADGGQAKTSVASRGDGICTQPILMVGYNRSFPPGVDSVVQTLTYKLQSVFVPKLFFFFLMVS